MAAETSLATLLAERTAPAAAELVRDEGEGLRCLACGHRCFVKPGRAGICKVRFNESGVLRVPSGYVAGLQVDPIEKKPFFHAYPGRDALSFGMLGCDLHCGYCQNWVTSQALRDPDAVAAPRFYEPVSLTALALANNAPVVVSTYNEPLITAEWAVEVFGPAKKAGLVCGFVSNGNATPEVLAFIRPYVDLYKVDLKAFDDKAYRRLGCTLKNVCESIERIHAMGFWLEIVTLLIPGFNDRETELRGAAAFLAGISRDIPWHLTAFHPDYKMTEPPRTTADSLVRAYDIAKAAGMRYVYPGNLPGQVDGREHTYCPGCGAAVIERTGFRVTANRMRGKGCGACGTAIPGVWEENPPRQSEGSGRPRPV